MIVLGLILLLLGLFVFHPLVIIGIIVGVVGLALLVVNGTGRNVGGRSRWY